MEAVSKSARKEMLAAVRVRYGQASWLEKGKILGEFAAVAGYHRKHAIRLLSPRTDMGSKPWLKKHGAKPLCIAAGSPWQNGFVESFHGRFRDERANREQLHTLTEARAVIEDYRQEYSRRHPHSRLGYLSPAAFAQRHLPSPVAVGVRPPSTGDGQTNTPQQTSTSA